jgi:hypothetical protein
MVVGGQQRFLMDNNSDRYEARPPLIRQETQPCLPPPGMESWYLVPARYLARTDGIEVVRSQPQTATA